MERMGRLLGSLVLALCLCGGWTTARAAELTRGVLQVSQDWVRKGETVDVTFSLDEGLEMADGLNVVAGTLASDQTVFRPLTAADIAPAQDWDEVYYNADTGRLLIISRAGDKDGGQVFSFRLTANARAGTAPLHLHLAAAAAQAQTKGFVVVPANRSNDVPEAAAARLMGMPARSVAIAGDTERATELVRQSLRSDDTLLVKGSRFLGLDRLVEEVC